MDIRDSEEFKEHPLDDTSEVANKKGYFEKNPKVARLVRISIYVLLHLCVVGYFSYATYHYHDISKYIAKIISKKYTIIYLQPTMSAIGKTTHCAASTSARAMECSCSSWDSSIWVYSTTMSLSRWWGTACTGTISNHFQRNGTTSAEPGKLL